MKNQNSSWKNDVNLLFDMDGVLYNLDEIAIDRANKKYNCDYNWKDNKSWFWLDHPKADLEYFTNLLLEKGLFSEGNPIPKSIEYMNKFINEGFNVYIVTTPTWNSIYCENEKKEFIRKYLPNFDINHNLIFISDKSMLVGKNKHSILIDDKLENCNNFNGAGGLAICFRRGYNEGYNGVYINDLEELYNKIITIE